MGLKLIIAFFLFQVPGTLSLPDRTIYVSDSSNVVRVGQNVFFLEDETAALTIEDIQASQVQSMFIQSSDGMLDFPANNSFYWIKMNLKITSEREFLLFIDEAKIDYADLYYQSSDKVWRIIRNGVFVPESEKDIIHNFQVYNLENNDGKPFTVYLRLNPKGLPLPIYVVSEKYFFQIYDTRFKVFFGVIVGIIVLICLNNLTLFFLERKKLRLLYFFSSLSFIIFSLFFNGYGLFFSDFLYKHTTHIEACLSFFSQFTIQIFGVAFLQIWTRAPWLRWTWKISVIITALLLIGCVLFPYYDYVWIAFAAVNGILSLFICLLSGIIVWRLTHVSRKPIFFIYSSSYILFLIFLSMELGHIYLKWPYVFFARYIELSFLFETVGLAMAQNRQTSMERREIEEEKIRTQNENIILINDRNSILEEQVNERTSELLSKTKIAEKLSEDLRIQSSELRNLNDFKDRLLSILAHDLRTPLSQLQGVLSLVDKAISEEELKFAINQIGKQLGRTVELSNNLLLWARSQMSGFKIKVKELNIYDLVKNKIIFFQSLADEKQIELINGVTPRLDFRSDENILNLLIHNLIYNAIKFSGSGDSITIYTNVNSTRLVIAVADTGMGMSSEEVQSVLGSSIYTKAGTANESGTGLGLKICKDLIQRIDGQIQIVSELGKGSTFYLDIPEMAMTSRERIVL
jgi:signal transduction histidine kinase